MAFLGYCVFCMHVIFPSSTAKFKASNSEDLLGVLWLRNYVLGTYHAPTHFKPQKWVEQTLLKTCLRYCLSYRILCPIMSTRPVANSNLIPFVAYLRERWVLQQSMIVSRKTDPLIPGNCDELIRKSPFLWVLSYINGVFSMIPDSDQECTMYFLQKRGRSSARGAAGLLRTSSGQWSGEASWSQQGDFPWGHSAFWCLACDGIALFLIAGNEHGVYKGKAKNKPSQKWSRMVL